MSTTLAWLVARLQAFVPAQDGAPTAAQYEMCCEDAVADLSRRKPLQKIATLSIVAGTAAYALPADFIRLASIEGLANNDGVLVTDNGLIDFGIGFVETHAIHGQTLTFSPTPTYTATRRIRYAAAHTLTDDAYPDLTAEDARLALIKAQALGWEMRAAALMASAYSFRIGEWSEDHVTQVLRLQNQVDALTKQYEAAVKGAVGPAGARGRGSPWTVPTRWEDSL